MGTFVVTAGHSNTDPGAVANGRKEADIACDMRNMIASKLRALGHKVFTDGDGKENQPLSKAIKLVSNGLAIEIHCNAASNPAATGVECISLPKRKELCQRLSNAIAATTKDNVRGDNGWIDQSKSARGKLGFVEAGGIIVELFFLSNKGALERYKEVKWLVASAIVGELVK